VRAADRDLKNDGVSLAGRTDDVALIMQRNY
jgi:hypothetical protein